MKAVGVEQELVIGDVADAGQHVGQHGSIEAGVLLGSELAPSIETEDGFQRGEVDEVRGGAGTMPPRRRGRDQHDEGDQNVSADVADLGVAVRTLQRRRQRTERRLVPTG